MGTKNMTPEPITASTTLGQKAGFIGTATGGITFPLWIDTFDHYAKTLITLIYLIVAIHTFYKTFWGNKKDDK